MAWFLESRWTIFQGQGCMLLRPGCVVAGDGGNRIQQFLPEGPGAIHLFQAVANYPHDRAMSLFYSKPCHIERIYILSTLRFSDENSRVWVYLYWVDRKQNMIKYVYQTHVSLFEHWCCKNFGQRSGRICQQLAKVSTAEIAIDGIVSEQLHTQIFLTFGRLACHWIATASAS